MSRRRPRRESRRRGRAESLDAPPASTAPTGIGIFGQPLRADGSADERSNSTRVKPTPAGGPPQPDAAGRAPRARRGADVNTAPLAALVGERRIVEEAIGAEVGRLRRRGVDWAAIGRALGVSRQAARQRYM